MGQYIIKFACLFLMFQGACCASSDNVWPPCEASLVHTYSRPELRAHFPVFSSEVDAAIRRLPTQPQDEDCLIMMVQTHYGTLVPEAFTKRHTLIERLYEVSGNYSPSEYPREAPPILIFSASQTALMSYAETTRHALTIPQNLFEHMINANFAPDMRRAVLHGFARQTPELLRDITFETIVTLRTFFNVLEEELRQNGTLVITGETFDILFDDILSAKKTLTFYGNQETPCVSCHTVHPTSFLDTPPAQDKKRAHLAQPFLLTMEHHRFACQDYDPFSAHKHLYAKATAVLAQAPLELLQELGSVDFSPVDRWRMLTGAHGLLGTLAKKKPMQAAHLLQSLTFDKLYLVREMCDRHTWKARDLLLYLSVEHLHEIAQLLDGIKNEQTTLGVVRQASGQTPSWLNTFIHLETPHHKYKIPLKYRLAFLKNFAEKKCSPIQMHNTLVQLENQFSALEAPLTWRQFIDTFMGCKVSHDEGTL